MLSKSVPYLPGHVFSDPYKTSFNKEQIFNYVTKTCIEKPRLLEKYDPYTLSSLRKSLAIPTSSTVTELDSTKRSGISEVSKSVETIPKLLPQWLLRDKQCLRFEGYFDEHISESAHENYRIRECVLYYYLEDDTVHIGEKRTMNSGIPQGVLVRRHRVINGDSENGDDPITWKDFKLGKTVYIYGKRFKICKCDLFTREFYKSRGIEIGPDEEIPQINYEDKFKCVDFNKIKQAIADSREYVEVGLGGGHPNRGLKQFLDNDRKVLSFDLCWFDKLYDKEEKKYKLNYYLADNQAEVCECRYNNSGKDPFPKLLKKCKLPKQPHMSYCPGLEVPEDEYYLPKDLICGNYIMVYNRKFQIVGCDEFTKKWYKDK